MTHLHISPNQVFATYSMLEYNQRVLDTLTSRISNKKGVATISLDEFRTWESALMVLKGKTFELSGKYYPFIRKIDVNATSAQITLDKHLIPMARTKISYPVAWVDDMAGDNNIKRLFERLFVHAKKGYHDIDVQELLGWLCKKDVYETHEWITKAVTIINKLPWLTVTHEHKGTQYIFVWDEKKVPARLLPSRTLVRQPKATQKHLARQAQNLQADTPKTPTPSHGTAKKSKKVNQNNSVIIGYQLCDSSIYKQTQKYGITLSSPSLPTPILRHRQDALMDRIERLMSQLQHLTHELCQGQQIPRQAMSHSTHAIRQQPSQSSYFSFEYDESRVGMSQAKQKGRKKKSPAPTASFDHDEITPIISTKRSELPDFIATPADEIEPKLDVFQAFGLLADELKDVQAMMNEFAPVARAVFFACKANNMSETTYGHELHKRLNLDTIKRDTIKKEDGYNLNDHRHAQVDCVVSYFLQLYQGSAKTLGDWSLADVKQPYRLAYYMTQLADRICQHQQLEDDGIITILHRMNIWRQGYQQGWYRIESVNHAKEKQKEKLFLEQMAKQKEAERKAEEIRKQKEQELSVKGRLILAQWLTYENSAVALFDELYNMQKGQMTRILDNIIKHPHQDVIDVMVNDHFGNMLGFALARHQERLLKGEPIPNKDKYITQIVTTLQQVYEKAMMNDEPSLFTLEDLAKHGLWTKRIAEVSMSHADGNNANADKKGIDIAIKPSPLLNPVVQEKDTQQPTDITTDITTDTPSEHLAKDVDNHITPDTAPQQDTPSTATHTVQNIPTPATSTMTDTIDDTMTATKHDDNTNDNTTEYNTGISRYEYRTHVGVDKWGNKVAYINGRDMTDDELTAELDPYGNDDDMSDEFKLTLEGKGVKMSAQLCADISAKFG